MRSLSPFQRVILILVALLAVGMALGAAWLLSTYLFGTQPASPGLTQPPTSTVSSLTATPLPEPVVRTLPPATPTPVPLVQPTDSSPQACLPAWSARVEARVLEVLAVNRIRVEVEGQKWEVIYLGVDPAGPSEPALAANQALVEGQTVTLIQDAVEADPQGARWRYVLAGETLVNAALIREGMAITALNPPGMACENAFLEFERAAQAQGVGFWAIPVPVRDPAVLTTVAVPPCPCNTSFTCADFSRRDAAQACYNACGDYRNAALDDDHDGLACEDLP